METTEAGSEKNRSRRKTDLKNLHLLKPGDIPTRRKTDALTVATLNVSHKIAKLIIVWMIVQLLMVGYVYYTGYVEDTNTVTAQRAGCERVKLDQKYLQFIVHNNGFDARVTTSEMDSVKYQLLKARFESRIRLDCAKVYPDPTLVP